MTVGAPWFLGKRPWWRKWAATTSGHRRVSRTALEAVVCFIITIVVEAVADFERGSTGRNVALGAPATRAYPCAWLILIPRAPRIRSDSYTWTPRVASLAVWTIAAATTRAAIGRY
ncbi:MAG: hypothetical protein ACREA0_30015, partial [bacterium]